MKTAIMQPYFFPYIGYFQMLNAVQDFVFLTDVNFIKRGWIHRNKFLLHGKEHAFTVPLKKPSQNKHINQIALSDIYDEWKEKFKQTLRHAYCKTDNFEAIYGQICRLLDYHSQGCASPPKYKNISELCIHSIEFVIRHLDIKTRIHKSENFDVDHKTGQDRIIRLCQLFKTSQYINAIGGKKLYDTNTFDQQGIDLRFITSTLNKTEDFNPNVSMLDLIFRYPKDQVKNMLYEYRLER